jgi:hypothetical protein
VRRQTANFTGFDWAALAFGSGLAKRRTTFLR